MNRQEIYAALKPSGGAEQLAADCGLNYPQLCQIIRLGAPAIGPEGSRTRVMACAVAQRIGKKYNEVWGEDGKDAAHAA